MLIIAARIGAGLGRIVGFRRCVLPCVIEFVGGDARFVEGSPAAAMAEHEFRDRSDVASCDLPPLGERGGGNCSTAQHEIGSQTFRTDLQCEATRQVQHLV
ncbi:MAG: hypothetical protein ABMA25_19740 [Ilumatobacteraceae bacterium]